MNVMYTRLTHAWHARVGVCPVRIAPRNHPELLILQKMITGSNIISKWNAMSTAGTDYVLSAFLTKNGKNVKFLYTKPGDEVHGYGYAACFSQKGLKLFLDEYKLDLSEGRTQELVDAGRDALNNLKFSACYCVIDEASIANFGFKKEQFGEEFTLIAPTYVEEQTIAVKADDLDDTAGAEQVIKKSRSRK